MISAAAFAAILLQNLGGFSSATLPYLPPVSPYLYEVIWNGRVYQLTDEEFSRLRSMTPNVTWIVDTEERD